jgi:hypothetical protein
MFVALLALPAPVLVPLRVSPVRAAAGRSASPTPAGAARACPASARLLLPDRPTPLLDCVRLVAALPASAALGPGRTCTRAWSRGASHALSGLWGSRAAGSQGLRPWLSSCAALRRERRARSSRQSFRPPAQGRWAGNASAQPLRLPVLAARHQLSELRHDVRSPTLVVVVRRFVRRIKRGTVWFLRGGGTGTSRLFACHWRFASARGSGPFSPARARWCRARLPRYCQALAARSDEPPFGLRATRRRFPAAARRPANAARRCLALPPLLPGSSSRRTNKPR